MLVLCLRVYLPVALAAQVVSGLTCLKCDDVTDHGTCAIVTCQSDEACITERMVDNSYRSRYFYGCQKRQVCQALDSGSGVLGRREAGGDGVETLILNCMQCCYTDMCNRRLCFAAPVPSRSTVMHQPQHSSSAPFPSTPTVIHQSYHSLTPTLASAPTVGITTPVPSMPTVVIQPTSIKTVQGANQDVTFSCDVTGVPTPQIIWFYNDTAGKLDVLHAGYTTVGASSNLTIKGVQVRNSGTYMCTAINNQGTKVASATLTVHEPPYFLNTTWETSMTVHRGQDVTIDCEGGGVPTPSIHWGIMDSAGFPVITGSHGENFVESNNHYRFTIVHAVEKNNGVYFCMLKNEVGQVLRRVEITVIP